MAWIGSLLILFFLNSNVLVQRDYTRVYSKYNINIK